MAKTHVCSYVCRHAHDWIQISRLMAVLRKRICLAAKVQTWQRWHQSACRCHQDSLSPQRFARTSTRTTARIRRSSHSRRRRSRSFPLTQTVWLQYEGWCDFLIFLAKCICAAANVRMSCFESCTTDMHWSCHVFICRLGLLPAGGRGSSLGWETHRPRVWWWYQPTSSVCTLWCPCIYARTEETWTWRNQINRMCS